MLTLERLKEVLRYCPETGEFRWLVSPSNSVRAGSVAGSVESNGYRRIAIDYTSYQATHLVWFYMTGEFPAGMVDHRNRSRDDNRWENLRPASRSQNNANSRVRVYNKLGIKGVKATPYGRFMANIKFDKKQRYLGTFDTAEEAHAAYMAAARQRHGDYASAGQ